MRIRLRIGLGVLALAGVLAAGSEAAAGVNAREHRQRHRIHEGVHDGSLTGGERHHLVAQQRRIERYERRSRHDGGGLGPWERARLDHLLDRSSRQIYGARHNDRVSD